MLDNQIINPDHMFDEIVNAVKEMNKKLLIHKKVLNYNTFNDILCMNPRILIIMCHGCLKVSKGQKKERCWFCFENVQFPPVVDEFDEDRL